MSASLNKGFSECQPKASSSASDDEDAVVQLKDMSVQFDDDASAKKHTSNSRKRRDGLVLASDGSLCAIAETPLVISLVGRHVGIEEAASTGLTATLDDPWRVAAELTDVVPVNFLALLLAMQVLGHANRLPCRRRAVGNAAAVGTLAIVRFVDLSLVWRNALRTGTNMCRKENLRDMEAES